MSLIYLEDNFITREQSKVLIDYYKEHLNLVQEINHTYALWLRKTYHNHSLIKTIVDKILSKCKGFRDDIEVDNVEIVRWPVKSYMNFHKDTGTEDIFASILYLNDNYMGGYTGFDFFEINPKIGRLLIFSNSYYRHCVKEIKKNSRYTLALWFTKRSVN